MVPPNAKLVITYNITLHITLYAHNIVHVHIVDGNNSAYALLKAGLPRSGASVMSRKSL